MSVPSAPTRSGLDEIEARRRAHAEGENVLTRDGGRGFGAAVLALVREPMVALLLGASGLYLALGDRIEASMLSFSVLVVVGLELVQSRRTDRAVARLRAMTSPTARVIREGKTRRVAASELVRGDVVLLGEGDRVPADARVLDVTMLHVDESLLTGEQAPVGKRAALDEEPMSAPGGDDTGSVFAGTLVVAGDAVVEVVATGARTAVGRIGASLGGVRPQRSPLAIEIASLVRRISVAAVIACVLLAATLVLRNGRPLEGLLAGVALAMGLLPEELPVVLTISLALGALRLSRVRVLVRDMAAIESLGAATILCADKTGTITENRMRVARLWTPKGSHDVASDEPLPDALHDVVAHGVRASRPSPVDPMEVALLALGRATLDAGRSAISDAPVRAYPLAPDLLAMTHVFRVGDDGACVASTKGAPETVIRLCRLDAEVADRVREATCALAADGLRVLAVATGDVHGGALPETQRALPLRFIGLIGFEDPVRVGVPEAVAACTAGGVRVLMITGDHRDTAVAIAHKARLPHAERATTGAELGALDDAALTERLASISVIARATPDLKFRVVRALAARGEVVAMTGDGVNDAPALKASHVGVAMGARGTDVAREAAALVLTDDDFSSIVAGVRVGRRIFDNLRKAVVYILAVHVPIVGLALIPALAGRALLLLPLQIVLLELLIDPACSLVFEAEPEERDVMRRPPRGLASRLVDGRALRRALGQGACVLVATIAILAYAASSGLSDESLRTVALLTLIGGNIGLIHATRTDGRGELAGRNRVARTITALAIGVSFLLVRVDVARDLLHLGAMPLGLELACLTLGAASVAWIPLARRLRGARSRTSTPAAAT